MPRALAVAALVVLLGCSHTSGTSPSSTTTAVGASAADGQPEIAVVAHAPRGTVPIGITGARSSDAHDELLVYFFGATGPDQCESSVSAVVDGPVVTLFGKQSHPTSTTRLVNCGDFVSTTTARVHAPSAARRSSFTDGATGAAIPIMDGATLLRPTHLPDGWTFVNERGRDGEWEQSYQYGADPNRLTLTLHQGREIDQLVPSQAWQSVRAVTIAGHPAELIAQGAHHSQLGLTWKQGSDDVLVYLSGADRAAGPMNEPLLLELAPRFSLQR
jgi:hypothetical protein